MTNNEEKMKRPLDSEELTLEQEEQVVGGVQLNTASFNGVNFNSSNLNTSNFNSSNYN